MKFFDLELGGLGSMPNRVVKETLSGNLVYLGGTTEEQCKLSDQEYGKGVIVFKNNNCIGETSTAYVSPKGCKCKK
jgi:hypothetical protein